LIRKLSNINFWLVENARIMLNAGLRIVILEYAEEKKQEKHAICIKSAM
jgi:hypothetical protein